MFVFEHCVQITMSGLHGSMLITPEAEETMSSSMPFAITTVLGCVRTPWQLKPKPLNGSQPMKLERRSMQTPLWASGALMRSRVLIETVPTTLFASCVPKVQSSESCFQYEKQIHTLLCLKSLTFDFAGDTPATKRELCWYDPLKKSLALSFPTDNSMNVEGTWGPWSDWSPCPALCGQLGVQLRTRNCQSYFTSCTGPKVEGKGCNGPECPKTGELELV